MASKSVTLDWTGEGLRFEGGAEGGPQIALDSAGVSGPSPTEALLMGVAGCMGIDVLMILQKGRVKVEALRVRAVGERAEAEPRRFTAIRLEYEIRGPAERDEAKMQRAVELSRDTYCSVLHTLRPDIDLDIRITRI